MTGNSPELTVLTDLLVEMRDGIRLATDIYLPCSGVEIDSLLSWPVLMERTPYNKQGQNRSEKTLANPVPPMRPDIAKDLARRGYVVVMQDCRGRYNSEGTFSKYLNEGEDGYDTMSWLVEQPWCNDKIGTFGVSYGSHTQIAAACLNPPGLASMFLDSGGFASAYHGGIRRGGAFELKQVTWAHKHALLSPKTKADPKREQALMEVDLAKWFNNMPWTPGHSPLSAAPEYESYMFEQWRSGEYSDYWKRIGLSAQGHYQDMPDIPVMILNSWYDPYVDTSITNFMALEKNRKSPVFLTMGPWTHGQRSCSFAGDVDFGPAAIFENNFQRTYIDYRCDWFDWCLKGNDDVRFDVNEPVNIFLMGNGNGLANSDGRLNHGGEWRAFSSWPAAKTRIQPYYLDVDGRLSTQLSSPENKHQKTLSYDPRKPTPTIGGSVTSGEPLMSGGAFDQKEKKGFFGCDHPGRDLKYRVDTLSFETDPLGEDISIAGPITASLWVSSDCLDTDFVVKLIDVHPPNSDFPEGFAMNVTDGILRTRYRNNGEKSKLLHPGKIYEIVINLFASANLFRRGHRIRVDIASCNYPQFDFNPNTGEPEGAWTSTRSAKNTVYMDMQRPSRIELPILSEDSGGGK